MAPKSPWDGVKKFVTNMGDYKASQKVYTCNACERTLTSGPGHFAQHFGQREETSLSAQGEPR